MKSSAYSRTMAIGFAMFSMFFGAGNVIFPLLLGAEAGDKNFFAMLGMLVTAIVVPFAGLVAVVLFDSDYKQFFGRIGRLPGYFLAMLILLLIGPFGGIPRCIALAHATTTLSFPQLPLWLFSGLACICVLVCTMRPSRIVGLLGYVLTPVLLISLLALIVLGVTHHPPAMPTAHTDWSAFSMGFLEGYNTLDLLAAFFFSSVVFASVKQWYARNGQDVNAQSSQLFKVMLAASIVGALLLGTVYAGLSFVASYHSSELVAVAPDQLLGALGFYLLGPKTGAVANVAVALACLTTAIALTSVFATALRRELFRGKISHLSAVAITLAIAYGISYLRVTGIVQLIAPVVKICYPALIALTVLNIAYKIGEFRPAKRLFYLVLGVTVAFFFVHDVMV